VKQIDRRKFLGIVGAGSAAAAVAVAPGAAALIARSGAGTVSFHAEKAMPEKPMSAYATAMVDGSVDLATGTGLVTTRMLAGHSASGIALPGLTRMVRVTRASVVGNEVHIDGVVEDRSQLALGESPNVRLVLDRAQRELRTTIGGSAVTLPVL
jgi:hypothetical protein